MFPLVEVIQAREDHWANYLVGIFLIPILHTMLFANIIRIVGILRVDCRFIMINLCSISCSLEMVERECVLEAEPSLIVGKPSIFTTCSMTIDSAREQVLYIHVSTYFSHFPSVLQLLIGLNWLASLVGNLKCFDANTVARCRIVYEKDMIEITSNKPLTSKLRVCHIDGHVTAVNVHHSWKPDICAISHSFGHLMTLCKHCSPFDPLIDRLVLISAMIPLPQSPSRK